MIWESSQPARRKIGRAIYEGEMIEDYQNVALLRILRQCSMMLDSDFEGRAVEQKSREA
jgi:hypothetical protein